ncbi:MAG: DUF3563 family protein [Burkholderiales bacterium]
MKYISDFLDRLAKRVDRNKRDIEEAYLAKSSNIYELESRMRELEQTSNFHPWARFTQH